MLAGLQTELLLVDGGQLLLPALSPEGQPLPPEGAGPDWKPPAGLSSEAAG